MSLAKASAEPPIDDPNGAWARFEPGGNRPWDARLAAHLLRRAGFGPNRAEIERAVSEGPQKTVDSLLDPRADLAEFEALHADYETSAAGSVDALRAWWLRRMIDTPHPLLEKMAVFWHGHFATSQAEVGSGPLMHRHVALLREHALGNFTRLFQAVSLDPALLAGLAARSNRKAVPPLAMARTLLGQFSLGTGNFTESDVTETARALTGWFVFRTRREFIQREHDDGEKALFGQRGRFTAEEALGLIARQRATAKTVVRKLYRQFVSESAEPADSLLEPLVDEFAKDHDIARVVETMLRSNWLYSPSAYRCRVKSPVEFAVGLVRAMEGTVATDRLARKLAQLGQNLYAPPTAAGWPDGLDWLDDATLTGRKNLAWDLLRPDGDPKCRLDAAALAATHGLKDDSQAGRFFLDLLLQGGSGEAADRISSRWSSSGAMRLAEAADRIASLPEYQLA